MTHTLHFSLKTDIVYGPGLLDRLEDFRGQRIGIITDAVMVSSGALERIRARLPDCVVTVFADVAPETPLGVIMKGTACLAEFAPDVIIALGGGSSMDTAKAIRASLREIDGSKRIILIAVPTTSGTGSEVTNYTVVSDPEQGRKYPLCSDDILPDIALLDPELVKSVPPHITADTGMDAITHGLEAYVSTKASDFTDAFVEKALDLAFSSLPLAYADGNDLRAREAMHHASCMAGIAFNAAGLGLAHALAHAIGGRFHISHGRINAMLLPHVIEFNAGIYNSSVASSASCLVTAKRYSAIGRRLGIESPTVKGGAKNLARAVSRLNARLSIPATLKALGIDMAEYARGEEELIQSALADTCLATNPLKPASEDIKALIRTLAGN
ncbi:1-propanol dehydrogenase PduQ [Telmatospirillum siberiense]|uniref:Alcohol dehydrogenase 2 n=1 Tax=Telmatospirillum siberiense TaxID=382514 RepID=A0A2N3Q116_9PROT|nr:1-propanol dehydrogenase PduQ [Telmatospirillum siberiense]PKU26344.1 alcohol dehydrogenase [Telmatospirillum siberiense]